MNLANMIDHTLLRANATAADIKKLCEEALEHGFYSVCVNPYWIPTCKEILKNGNVKICTVAGFPLGATSSKMKTSEVKMAVDTGADEVDVVMNLGAALGGHWNFVEHETHELVSVARGHMIKVILETCYLKPEEITAASQAAQRGGAHFIKTSTGFGPSGATVEAVKLMKQAVNPFVQIKASGGIKDRKAAEAMIEAGASRLGTSSSVTIVKG
jgi:deoxyribose-phosphate aldolase